MKSIIIPVYNNFEYTYECIVSILENTNDCEIVVIDNGSNPPFKPPFSGFTEINVIRNDENKGFPVAVNQGIRAAKGDIIVLLNNDVIVTPGWADELSKWLREFSIVGPMTNYAGGMQRITIEVYNSKNELYEKALNFAQENEGHAEKVNFVIGFCMMFQKSLFDEIGEFDTTHWPCCGEEVDFCLRAKAVGHNVGIAYDVYVHHEGSMTFQEMEKNGITSYPEICEKNDRYLIEKYGPMVYKQTADPEKKKPDGIIKLNLGCGYRKMTDPEWVNIDNRIEVEPDIVCDILEGLPYEDSSIEEVRAYDFLEHIPLGNQIQVITEIWRVLKPGGMFESLTPSTDGRGAFMDPTHLSFWNACSWYYYSDSKYRAMYGIKADFEIETMKDIEVQEGYEIVHTFVRARAKK